MKPQRRHSLNIGKIKATKAYGWEAELGVKVRGGGDGDVSGDDGGKMKIEIPDEVKDIVYTTPLDSEKNEVLH